MKKIVSLLALSFFVLAGNAQDYTTSAGLRLGAFNGLTVKHFIGDDVAVEGILSTRWSGFNLTGLYQWHNDTKYSNLKWYYGAGAHVGFWNGANVGWADGDDDYVMIGADGIIGLEYVFDAPFNISLDYILTLNVVEDFNLFGDGFGLSVRYVF